MSSVTSRRAKLLVQGLLLTWVGVSACSTTVAVRKTAAGTKEQTSLSSLGIVKLHNLSSDPKAADVLSLAISHAMRPRLRVVEDVSQNPVDRMAASEAGKSMKVDAVLVGEVTAFEYVRSSRGISIPVIGVDLRLINTKDAHVRWAAGIKAQRNQMLTYDSVALQELAQEVADAVVGELERMLEAG